LKKESNSKSRIELMKSTKAVANEYFGKLQNSTEFKEDRIPIE